MPETFDLDRAFDDLTSGVASRTRPAGADRAIAVSRRRRTSLGAVAAVALLSVGAVAVSQLGGGDQSSPPPAGGPSDTVSVDPDVTDLHVGDPDLAVAPAPLDAAALTKAFQGQMTWTRGNAVPDTTAACTAVLGGEAQSETTTEFRSGRTLGAARTFARFASASDAGQVLDDLVGDLRACNSRQVSVGRVPLPQGRGVYATVPSNENAPSQLIWLVRIENRIGILTVVGVEDEPGEEIVQSVADAVLAGTMD